MAGDRKLKVPRKAKAGGVETSEDERDAAPAISSRLRARQINEARTAREETPFGRELTRCSST